MIFIAVVSTLISARNIDSLITSVGDPVQSDTLRLKVLEKIADSYQISNPDSVIIWANKLDTLAEKLKNEKFKGIAYNYLGNAYFHKGELATSFKYHHKAVVIREKSAFDRALAGSYSNIGVVYHVLGKKDEAVEAYTKSMEVLKTVKHKTAQGNVLNNLGLLFAEEGNYELALEYYKESLAIQREVNNPYGEGIVLENIGAIYQELNKPAKALEMYKKSEEIQTKNNDLVTLGKTLIFIGNLALEQQNYDLAKQSYEKGLAIHRKTGDSLQIAKVTAQIGNMYLQQGHLSMAQEKGEVSLSMGHFLASPEVVRDAALLLYKATKQLGEKDEALAMLELHESMKDSLTSVAATKKLEKLEMKFKLEKHLIEKKQIEEEEARQAALAISRKNSLQYSIIGIGLFILFIFLFLVSRVELPSWLVELLVFLPVLIFFEFVLVLTDPQIEAIAHNEPIKKLAFNAVLAGAIFPLHTVIEQLIKKKILGRQYV